MSRLHRSISITLAVIWFAAIAPGAALAQSVTRGPYLQSGTQTSVVVRWRTSTATTSRVIFAGTPLSLTSSCSDTGNSCVEIRPRGRSTR